MTARQAVELTDADSGESVSVHAGAIVDAINVDSELRDYVARYCDWDMMQSIIVQKDMQASVSLREFVRMLVDHYKLSRVVRALLEQIPDGQL